MKKFILPILMILFIIPTPNSFAAKHYRHKPHHVHRMKAHKSSSEETCFTSGEIDNTVTEIKCSLLYEEEQKERNYIIAE